jgi:hypothetical protein
MSGQVMYYPYTPGANVRALTGTTRLSGAELANPSGHASDVLVGIDWLWGLMRPVTSLLDGPHRLHDNALATVRLTPVVDR